MSTPNNKPTELTKEELQNTNGGGLLDDLSITNVAQGYVDSSSTDEDGQTESDHLGFGAGSASIFED